MDKYLFVTSDIELQNRLREKGATSIMKAGTFFKLVKKKLGEDIYSGIVESH